MPDIREIPLAYTVIAQLAASAMYVILEKRRYSAKITFLITLCFGILHGGLLLLTKNKNPDFAFCYLLSAIFILFLYVFLTTELNMVSAAYCTVRGFILGEFTAAAEWLGYVYFANKSGIASGMIEILFMAVSFTILYAIAYKVEKTIDYDYKENPITIRELIYVVVMAAAGFSLGNAVDIKEDVPEKISFAFYNTRAMMAFGSTALLYAYHVFRKEIYADKELQILNYLNQKQYEQYQNSKQNSEIVSIKYHDLKQQIDLLRSEVDSKNMLRSIERIENDIKNFENTMDLGNGTLNTIFTAKKAYCMAHDITMTVVADGKLLDFMEPIDVVSIFGNALDNAIQCEEKIESCDKRFIHVFVTEERQFIVIHIENYCEEKLEFSNGIPVTTHIDTNFHGFGMKSIQSAALRYGGVMSVENKNNWFTLNIVIPVKNS